MNQPTPTAPQPPLTKRLRKALRVVSGSNISRMAAALSYRTVFGLIPMIAIGVAVLGGLATDKQVTYTVERVLDLTGLNEIVVAPEPAGTDPSSEDPQGVGDGAAGDDAALGPQGSTALDDWLKGLVDKVRSVSFVAIGVGGLFILAYAAISFMVEIERSANHIYRAPTGRSWVRRVTQYWTTLTLGTIFLVGTFYVGDRLTDTLTDWTSPPSAQVDPAAAQAATTGAAATGDQKIEQTFGAVAAGLSVSLLIDFILLFFVYTTVPNARVNMRCAAIGAALAAVLWETGKWGFKIFVAHSSTQTLYGAIALIPLFLLWVYITWIIVLSGLQISYVLQHFGSFADADDERRGPMLVDPLTLVRVAIEVARQFTAGEKATVPDVAKAVGLDEQTSLTMLERLTDAEILNRVPEGQEHELFALARPADHITAAELLQLAGRMSESRGDIGDSPRLARLRRAQLDAAEDTNLADLVGDAPSRPTTAPEPAPEAPPEAEPTAVAPDDESPNV